MGCGPEFDRVTPPEGPEDAFEALYVEVSRDGALVRTVREAPGTPLSFEALPDGHQLFLYQLGLRRFAEAHPAVDPERLTDAEPRFTPDEACPEVRWQGQRLALPADLALPHRLEGERFVPVEGGPVKGWLLPRRADPCAARWSGAAFAPTDPPADDDRLSQVLPLSPDLALIFRARGIRLVRRGRGPIDGSRLPIVGTMLPLGDGRVLISELSEGGSGLMTQVLVEDERLVVLSSTPTDGHFGRLYLDREGRLLGRDDGQTMLTAPRPEGPYRVGHRSLPATGAWLMGDERTPWTHAASGEGELLFGDFYASDAGSSVRFRFTSLAARHADRLVLSEDGAILAGNNKDAEIIRLPPDEPAAPLVWWLPNGEDSLPECLIKSDACGRFQAYSETSTMIDDGHGHLLATFASCETPIEIDPGTGCAAPVPVPEAAMGGDWISMARIPGGTFLLGSHDGALLELRRSD